VCSGSGPIDAIMAPSCDITDPLPLNVRRIRVIGDR